MGMGNIYTDITPSRIFNIMSRSSIDYDLCRFVRFTRNLNGGESLVYQVVKGGQLVDSVEYLDMTVFVADQIALSCGYFDSACLIMETRDPNVKINMIMDLIDEAARGGVVEFFMMTDNPKYPPSFKDSLLAQEMYS